MPVSATTPPGTTSEKAWLSRSTSPHVQPAWARTVRATGSMRIPRMGERSIISAPSCAAWPAMPWPPPLTVKRTPSFRARLTVSMTSDGPAHCTIAAGRRSNMPFHSCRAAS